MNEENTYLGTCTELRCMYGRKPQATWFNTFSSKWICYPCAQAQNRAFLQFGQITTRACISGKEKMLLELTK